METNISPLSTKDLFKSSWEFYKQNWKKIVYLFLPLEIVVLVSYAILDILPTNDSSLVILSIVVFTALAFIFKSLVQFVALDAPRVVGGVVAGESVPQTKVWYKSVLKKIVPISIVLVLVGIANFTFLAFVILGGGFIISAVAFLFKAVPLNSFAGVLVGITTFVFVTYFAFKYVVRFFVGTSFSIYTYIFEGRTGLDAVTTSFLITKGNRFKVFWNLVLIWLVTLIPSVVLVFPINLSILIAHFGDIFYQATVLHQEPVLPESPLYVSLLLDIAASVATLISTSLLVVFNYFLWRGVRSNSVSFAEGEYNKTRKMLRSLVTLGIVLIVIVLAITLVGTFISW